MSNSLLSPNPDSTVAPSVTPVTQSASTAVSSSPTASGKLSDLAGAAKADRNRAIDFYRAVAMLAVAVGHWMAMDVALDASGELVAGNALEAAPGLAVMSWLFQVMPLFFVVGGFSSAMSLDKFFTAAGTDKHRGEGRGRPQDWVIARMRRMLAPTITLASVWAVLIAGGFAFGQGALIAVAATAAAIPLWFLANYTIDTAIAPYVLPRFRKHPVAVPAMACFPPARPWRPRRPASGSQRSRQSRLAHGP